MPHAWRDCGSAERSLISGSGKGGRRLGSRCRSKRALESPDQTPRFLALVLGGDSRGAHRLAAEIFEAHDATFLYEEVVAPALRQVGQLWFDNQITVADEHLATATAQAAIAGLYPRFPWTHGGPRALVACVPGERHEFGARMVADLLILDGWEARFFGADVPAHDVAIKAHEVGAKVVALSVTLATHVPAAFVAIEAIRRTAPSTKIIVGGLGTQSDRQVAAFGADGYAERGSAAVEVLRAWK